MTNYLHIRNSDGATMLETAIVLTCFLGVLFATLSFCSQMYQVMRLGNALRLAGRITAIEAGSPGTERLAADGCAALARQRFESAAGSLGLLTAANVHISIEEAGSLRGVRVSMGAEASTFFSPIKMLPGQLHVESFFPLEDQNACQ